jgi:hypothetical protein
MPESGITVLMPALLFQQVLIGFNSKHYTLASTLSGLPAKFIGRARILTEVNSAVTLPPVGLPKTPTGGSVHS